jgi:hypothetical protein
MRTITASEPVSGIAPVRTLTAEERNTALDAVKRRRESNEQVVMVVRIASQARIAAQRAIESRDRNAGTTDPALLNLKSTDLIGDVKPEGPGALTISDPRVVAGPSRTVKTINPALSAVNAAAVRLPTTISDPSNVKLVGASGERSQRFYSNGARPDPTLSVYA